MRQPWEKCMVTLFIRLEKCKFCRPESNWIMLEICSNFAIKGNLRAYFLR